MRYYIINSDGKEVSFDLSGVRTTAGMRRYAVTNTGSKSKKEFYVRNLAGKSYISEDNETWEKLPKLTAKKGLINVNETLNIYQGFKPSGLSQASAGELVTDMPGKVVKLMTSEGAMVSEGDTLLILEAMKMENEVKAGVSGIVKAVHVSEGQVLESGQLMIEIEE